MQLDKAAGRFRGGNNLKSKYNIMIISHSTDLLGAEQSLLFILKRINTEQFNIVVVCPHEGPIVQEIRKQGFDVEFVPIKWWIAGKVDLLRVLYRIPFHIFSVIKIVRLIKKHKIDLVHVNSIVTFEGAVAARLLKIPCVWHLREIFINNRTLRPALGVKSTIRLINKLSNKVVCVSDAVKQSVIQHGEISGEKFEVLYNAVDAEEFKEADGSRFRRELDISQETFVIGIVGSIQEKKGHEELLYAASKIVKAVKGAADVKFVIVGEGSQKYISRLKFLVEELCIKDYIIFAGFYTNIPEVMSGLDLLVVPSWEEPFGRVVIEAMAAAKPVIGANSGGIPEIIEDGKTGLLFKPKDPIKLYEAITLLIEDSNRAEAMGIEGEKRVRRLFNPRKHISSLEKIYLEQLKIQNPS